VADKKEVRRGIRRLQYLKTWQLVILLVLVGFIASTFLRLNNIGMVQRRDAVAQADKAGDVTAIQARLFDLQRYVSSHMNTTMGDIYLEHQYKRNTESAISIASGASGSSGNIYKQAQDVCAPKFRGYSQAYLQCTLDYLSQFTQSEDPVSKANLPKADAYRYSYVSPLWSPDFAGFSVLIWLLILLVLIGRLVALFTLKLMLKSANR
jgi:hypothetical protein